MNIDEANWVKQEGGNFWKPSAVGEQLVGQVVEIIDDPKFGKQFWVVKSTGEKLKTPSHKVLQSRMEDAVVGTIVKIVYRGQEPPVQRGNRPTEMYEVFFQKKTQQGDKKAGDIAAFV